ncbi:MAG: hypothetical protein VX705_09275 [Verrucomicrobiota bacterium]|nr:hypothetical protein [Verrucomicrobiota bacterium]
MNGERTTGVGGCRIIRNEVRTPPRPELSQAVSPILVIEEGKPGTNGVKFRVIVQRMGNQFWL